MSDGNGIGAEPVSNGVDRLKALHVQRSADLARLRSLIERLGPDASTPAIKEEAAAQGVGHIADDQRISAARKALGFPPRPRGGNPNPLPRKIAKRSARHTPLLGSARQEALASRRLDEGDVQTIVIDPEEDATNPEELPAPLTPVDLLAELAVVAGKLGGIEAARRTLNTLETIQEALRGD